MSIILGKRNSSAVTSSFSKSLDSRKLLTYSTNREHLTEFNLSGQMKLVALTHLMHTSLTTKREIWEVLTGMTMKGQVNH